MWQCVKCREKLEDSFDICWHCGTSKDGTEDPDFRKADAIGRAEMEGAAIAVTATGEQARERPEKNPIFCPRCERKLVYVGTKKFHEGTRAWGFLLGDLGELFVNREHFDVYLCSRCGRVEFFLDGVGEEFRPH
jgi:hypothetical protein